MISHIVWKKVMKNLITFLDDEQGTETVEWVMIAAILAAILAAASWDVLGVAVNNLINSIANSINSVL
jgi:Flp pilus assembly pilin Flp